MSNIQRPEQPPDRNMWTRANAGASRLHGRAWRWIFVCGLWCFWMFFDPCLRNLMLWTYLLGDLSVICEFERKTFIWRSWRTFLEAWELLFWIVWERLSVTAFYCARLWSAVSHIWFLEGRRDPKVPARYSWPTASGGTLAFWLSAEVSLSCLVALTFHWF